MPRLAYIQIFPIKSLDPVELAEATVLASGGLQHDRRFAMFDDRGRLINGKRTERVHTLRARYDLQADTMSLDAGEAPQTFHFEQDRAQLERRLAQHFGLAVSLRENVQGGFPDDTESPGPTIISSATLRNVADWFPGITLDEARKRFRANLEIDDVEPFWEDRLYGEEGAGVRFRIGEVEFVGTNPCQRCAVPPRDSGTGEKRDDFIGVFEERRYEALPWWATKSRFDHFYRLAVNTRPASSAGGVIRVGDQVEIVG